MKVIYDSYGQSPTEIQCLEQRVLCSENHENIQISVDGNSFIFSISRKKVNRNLNILVTFTAR